MAMETNNISKEYLEKLVAELVTLGENQEELSMWIELYDTLSEEERKKIILNLEKESKDLRSLQQ